MVDHFVVRCSCGRVLAQCRCPGPKPERVTAGPCPHNQPAGGPSTPPHSSAADDRAADILDQVLGPAVIAGETVRLPEEE